MNRIPLLLLLLVLFSACSAPTPPLTRQAASTPAAALDVATSTPRPPTAPLAPSSTPSLTPTPRPTASPTLSPTPDPYQGLTIADLAARRYGGGSVHIGQTLAVTGAFTRTLITYPSDGLTIYGFMDVPRGPGPFPVVIALHGYVSPSVYSTVDYTTRYADALAAAGYLVLHPNLRGFPPSDNGPDRFLVGQAIDVLNLIALVRETAGKPGPLQAAEPQAIGLWGHSNGGGIALRVITVSADVRAAVLYGAMSGDEKKNYEQRLIWSGGRRTPPELSTPAEALARISAINYLERIQAAVSIHHGAADTEVPPAWSADLYARLQDLHKNVEYYSYPEQNHILHGPADTLFIQRMIAFYDRLLK